MASAATWAVFFRHCGTPLRFKSMERSNMLAAAKLTTALGRDRCTKKEVKVGELKVSELWLFQKRQCGYFLLPLIFFMNCCKCFSCIQWGHKSTKPRRNKTIPIIEVGQNNSAPVTHPSEVQNKFSNISISSYFYLNLACVRLQFILPEVGTK